MRSPLGYLLAIFVAAAAALLWPRAIPSTDEVRAGDSDPRREPVRRTSPAAKPLPTKIVPLEQHPSVKATVHMILPSGENVPALNGVNESVKLLWPTDLPYSPIVGTQREVGGLEWYVHADGSRSTTQMVFRSDVGRKVAMSVVANPKTPVPIQTGADEEAENRRRAAKRR